MTLGSDATSGGYGLVSTGRRMPVDRDGQRLDLRTNASRPGRVDDRSLVQRAHLPLD
jgi:hypothetical protein